MYEIKYPSWDDVEVSTNYTDNFKNELLAIEEASLSEEIMLAKNEIYDIDTEISELMKKRIELEIFIEKYS